jgi:hypothetical protein
MSQGQIVQGRIVQGQKVRGPIVQSRIVPVPHFPTREGRATPLVPPLTPRAASSLNLRRPPSPIVLYELTLLSSPPFIVKQPGEGN